MKNLSISKKLIVGFGSILVMILITIGMAVYSIGGINTQIQSYAGYMLPNSTSIWMVQKNAASIQRYIAQAISETDSNKITAAFDLAQEDSTILWDEFQKFSENQRDTGNAEKIAQLSEYFTEAGGVRQEIVEIMKSPNNVNILRAKKMFMESYLPIMDDAGVILADFTVWVDELSAQQEQDATASVRLAWVILLACGATAIGFSVLLIILIRRSILAPVKEIVGVYSEMAKGYMNVPIRYESRDELGQMATLIQKSNMLQGQILEDIIEKLSQISQGNLRLENNLEYAGDYAVLQETVERTAANLNDSIWRVSTAAEQVATGSDHVSAGAQALASGSAEQAASIEELATSLERIAEQAEDNSAVVANASQLVQQTGMGVSAGNQHMTQLTQAMSEISSNSNQIANITKVIEDIAFQTNILALNAAIEAARAGAAGKGFAVVADEVRHLAAKSAEAAKQTGDLIQTSVITVTKGEALTSQTAKILQDVGTSTSDITQSFSRIEQSIADQTAAIEQIRDGLSQISAVVQTNAATAQQNSATSEEMSAQAATLQEEVGKFTLDTAETADVLHLLEDDGTPSPFDEEIPFNFNEY